MTTDAKIGLLLALIFIVAITFVINGLPDFLSKNAESTPDTTSYISHYQQQRPIAGSASRNIATNLHQKPIITVITEAPKIEQNQESFTKTRYQTILPAAKEAVKPETVISEPVKKEVVEIKPVAKQKPASVYVVSPSDSLAKIAKKFYGEENGNKLSSIEKIYSANKDKLKSIDEIYVGQKLIIPSLKEQAKNQSQKPEESKGNFRLYIVKESDSLWQIADEHLGSGERYNEIVQLNKSILKNPEALAIGIKLKLPVR